MTSLAAALEDLRPVRREILLCLLLATLGTALAAFMAQRAQQAAEDARSWELARQKAGATVARLKEGAGRLRQDIARLQRFAARGMLGAERRPEWIEQISQIQQRHPQLGLEYQFAASQPLLERGRASQSAPAAAATRGSSTIQHWVSVMKLRLRPLHEVQLLAILDDLAAIDSALVRVRRCRIERVTQPDTEVPAAAPARPGLQADCDVDWITLRQSANP